MDPVKRAVLYSLIWLAAVTVATGIALAAVRTVEAAHGRGPLGPEVERIREIRPSPIPTEGTEALPKVTEEVRGRYGTFVVSCLGPYAVGEAVRPAQDAGWRAISFEPGPDDDVDAVFVKASLSLEVEVFCDQGRPTIADIEHNRFTGE